MQAVVDVGEQTEWMTKGDDPWEVFVCHVPSDTQSVVYAGLPLAHAAATRGTSSSMLNDKVTAYFDTLSHGVYRPHFVAGGEVTIARDRRTAGVRRQGARRVRRPGPRRDRRCRRRAQRRPARRVRQSRQWMRRHLRAVRQRAGDRRTSVPRTSARTGVISRRWISSSTRSATHSVGRTAATTRRRASRTAAPST